ncbi:Zinc/iron permease [Cercophora samala]|uniref:Zinc/iron permease n=1 Tax=Cercophora samala TaxID=330535 RepID=A0AA39ZC02_9PEZI|nr:Zinc/iron permease [Cercophora samala]
MEPNSLALRATREEWSQIPTSLLLAELSRRDDADHGQRPACGSGKNSHGYDTPLHVFALFLILTISTLACAFPLFSQRVTKPGKRQRNILFVCQHFGTGVLMATAFVHLLPTAFVSLTDPCLPHAFSKGYRPLAGLIAMIAAFVVVVIESILSSRGAGHSHSHSWDDEGSEQGHEEAKHTHAHGHGGHSRAPDIVLDDLEGTGEHQGLVSGASPLPGGTPLMQAKSRHSRDSFERERESLELELSLDELGGNGQGGSARLLATSKPLPALPPHAHSGHHHQGPPNVEEQQRMMLQCVLLEAGILFHSVFIGMALSVATGPTFAVFLLAISFHQSFEGLALGTRIAALHFPKSSPRPWLMVLAFGLTTPIGQAIGLFVHRFYDPMSQTGLLMVGFMNAISAGLLLFAGLVQLLAEDFLSEKSYKTLTGRKRVNAFLAVAGGASLMSLVGAFA